MGNRLLDVKGLHTRFYAENRVSRSVNDVSFSLDEGETLAIVGESGCGKSVTSLSILGLISPPGKVTDGSAVLAGTGDLLSFSDRRMRSVRGKEISMIYQEPMTSLNPVLTIADQLTEVYRLHEGASMKQAYAKSADMLDKVGFPDPAAAMRRYPHQLSGGMRQRVMIAMALACKPRLLIADEPTTALDVTIQAQILDLIQRLCKEQGTGVILITHDLGVVAEMADRVAVMYAGEIVEESSVYRFFEHPQHPYSVGLLASMLPIHETERELEVLSGNVPQPWETHAGCPFADRCRQAMPVCRERRPSLAAVADGHRASCFATGGEVYAQ